MENIYRDEIEPLKPKGECMMPFNNLYIDHLGRVQACCMSNLVLGNINNETIDKIWNKRQPGSLGGSWNFFEILFK